MAPPSRYQIILVMGVTGVGKSTFIRHATGLDVKVGHGQHSCTNKVECYQIPDTNVYLMDTPGFDDTKISDAAILNTIAKFLVDAFNDQAEIQGALYIHPVTEAKMRGSGRKNLIMFTKVLGMKGMTHCRLVTTKWSSEKDHQVSEGRERELCEGEEFWKPLLDAGACTVRFNDSMQSAIEIIKPLVHGSSFEPLLIEEVVRQKKDLGQTQAGQVVNDDVEEAKKAYKAEIKELKKAEAKARGEFAELLRAERAANEVKLKKLAEDSATLAQPVKKSGSFGRWIARAAAVLAGGFATAASGGWLAPAAVLLYGATESAIRDK